MCAHQSFQQLKIDRRANEQHSLQFSLQFCSRFELHDRDLGELHVAAKIVRVEDGFDVLQAVASEGRDLGNRGVGKGEPDHR